MARQHTPVFQPPRLRDDGPMYARRAHEIFRLEHDELLYRMYLYPEGEVIFSVTGDNIRLARIFHRSRATNEDGIALVCPKIQVSNLDQRAGNAEAKLYRRN